jgi:hypothetical protein
MLTGTATSITFRQFSNDSRTGGSRGVVHPWRFTRRFTTRGLLFRTGRSRSTGGCLGGACRSTRLQRGTDLLDRYPKVLHGQCSRSFAIAQQGVKQVPIRPGRFERTFGPSAKGGITLRERSATPLRSATLDPLADYGRVEIEGG